MFGSYPHSKLQDASTNYKLLRLMPYLCWILAPRMCCSAGLTADEELARQLQAEYDHEVASHVLEQADDAAMRRMAGTAFNTSPHSTPSTAHSSQSAASPASQPGRPASGVAPVPYPSIGNSGTLHMSLEPTVCGCR